MIVDRNLLPTFPGYKEGDVVFATCLSIPKDAACPFWVDYVRVSVREMVRRGIDGVWCDNFSPWDNFAQLDRAFGDWSEYRFRGFLRERVPASERSAMGVGDAVSFDLRAYLKKKAAEFGAKERPNRLRRLTDLVGRSTLLDEQQLPTTVGLFGWRSADSKAVFLDLVNYDLDLEADRITPARELTVRVRLPANSGALEAATLSPDAIAPASIERRDDWALIRLPQLIHFASVKLTLN